MEKLTVIARIENDYMTKFGIPRQSGLVPEQTALVVFEPEYRDANALRGLEDYSFIWLIWGFSEVRQEKWSPTVLPPRLGGNTRMGVFATRSPNRPNPIGLSCVALEGIETKPGLGAVLRVSGADLMNGSPIYDIKPYLAQTECHPQAKNGFSEKNFFHRLEVVFPGALLEKVPAEKRAALKAALALDPRPAYQADPALPYGFLYAGFDIRFRVAGSTLTVFEVSAADAAHLK